MPKTKPLTAGMLTKAPKGAFLYCPLCESRWSAKLGDYFMLPDDRLMVCEGPDGAHQPEPLRLMRRVVKLVPVELED